MPIRLSLGRYVIIALVLAACGSTQPTDEAVTARDRTSNSSLETPTTAAAVPRWAPETLGSAPIGGASIGLNGQGQTVILSADPSGGLVWLENGAEFEAGLIDGIVSEEAGWVGPVNSNSGMVAARNNYETFKPQIWRSADGLQWQQVETVGLDQSGDAISIISIDERVFLVGVLRVGEDPGDGPFEPAIWTSDDLVSWDLASIETLDGGSVSDVAKIDGGLLAVGQHGYNGPAAWISGDNGITWTIRRDLLGDEGTDVQLVDMSRTGETVTILARQPGEEFEGETVVLASRDGARTWTSGRLDRSNRPSLQFASQLTYASGAFWVVGERLIDPASNECYEDVEACGRVTQSALFRSVNGESWDEVDLDVFAAESYFRVLSVGPRGDGVVVLTSEETSLVAWTWPSAEAPPMLAEVETSKDPVLETVRSGANLEVGQTYRYPLYTHCGIGYLGEFNDMNWFWVDPATGALASDRVRIPDSTLPMARQSILGTVTVVDESTIEYSIESGEVIATYAPSDTDPPLCM